MFDFFANTSENTFLLDDKYDGLRNKVTECYTGHDEYRRLLINQIEALKRLEKEYPNKESINLAFDLLDHVSKKDFRNINLKIQELQKTASEDTMEFNFIKACVSLVFLPIIIPVLLCEIIVAIAEAYRFMMLMQIALLAVAITLTTVFLPPVLLLATIPAALLLNHVLSEFFLNRITEQIAYDIGVVFSSFFYDKIEPLKEGLDGIVNIANKAHSHVEGPPVIRFLRDVYEQLSSCFSSDHSELSGLEEEQTMVSGFLR